MNKVLVEVFLPAAAQRFDMFIPLDSQMGEVTALAAQLLETLSRGKFSANDTSALCDAHTGEMYDINMYAADLGLQNGSRLLLI